VTKLHPSSCKVSVRFWGFDNGTGFETNILAPVNQSIGCQCRKIHCF